MSTVAYDQRVHDKHHEDGIVADPAEATLEDIRDDIQDRVTTLLRQPGV